jgi:hypothetical protein
MRTSKNLKGAGGRLCKAILATSGAVGLLAAITQAVVPVATHLRLHGLRDLGR